MQGKCCITELHPQFCRGGGDGEGCQDRGGVYAERDERRPLGAQREGARVLCRVTLRLQVQEKEPCYGKTSDVAGQLSLCALETGQPGVGQAWMRPG